MQFGWAHKFTTYLMVGCSFFAVVLSGELSPLVWVPALIGFILSWRLETPKYNPDKYMWIWTTSALLGFVFSIFRVFAGYDVVVSGAEYLLLLQTAKLFSKRTLRDVMQIYILSFLMLVAGTVLNAEVTYGLFFFGYVIASTWALIVFHLRREVEQNWQAQSDGSGGDLNRILASKKVVTGRFLFGTSMLSVAVFISSVLLFLLIPRIGFGLFFHKTRSGPAMAGFHDGVSLGGHGTIRDDSTVVMRVKLDQKISGEAISKLHWRGVAFDTYSHGEWRRSLRAPLTHRQITLEGRMVTHHILGLGENPKQWQMAQRLQGLLKQEIYLEPLGSDVMFVASTPKALSFQSVLRDRAKTERNDEIRHNHSAGIHYAAYSSLVTPSAEVLRASSAAVPDEYSIYLQLPPELPERIKDLAKEITAGKATLYDKAMALQSWLRSNLTYTLEMKSPNGMEPVDFFLFERKQGHCEYFASALALMARSIGIASRNVNGFLGGEWNEYSEYIAVRGGDAHSWVELYFPGYGWVTFDPTPPSAVVRDGSPAAGIVERLRRLADTVRFKWFKWVIEYDLSSQMGLFKKVGQFFKGSGKSLSGVSSGLKAWFASNKKTLVGIVLVITGAICLWIFLRRKRADGLAMASAQAVHKPTEVTKIYRNVLSQLGKAGYPKSPGQTPREFYTGLRKNQTPWISSLAELTELHYATEYQGPNHAETTSTDQISQARKLAREIKEGLHKARANS